MMEHARDGSLQAARMLKLQQLFGRAMEALEQTLPMAIASGTLTSDVACRLHSVDLGEPGH
jgi:hypothetical protein